MESWSDLLLVPQILRCCCPFCVAVLHVNPESVDPGLAVALATVCWVDVCFDLSWLVLLFLQAKVHNWSTGLVCEN
jgi:hypothetical protein